MEATQNRWLDSLEERVQTLQASIPELQTSLMG